MTATVIPDSPIRWKSLAGIGLVLVLLYGVGNFAAAIGVPIALEANGGQGGGSGGVIIASDMAALGATGAMRGAWMVVWFAIPAALGSLLMIVSRHPSTPSVAR